MDGWMDGWMGGWMDEGMDGGREGWVDGWTVVHRKSSPYSYYIKKKNSVEKMKFMLVK